uniref:Pentapeptide repeat-containing protein n=1 Tax=Candidatus Kentrum sp. LFY TaxID=2126342 RepID=A0A450U5U2_9GAMM|nr:MAG: Pentapeptide repeat-containing protein [Candidatus Kentron sp. LFY]
MGLYGIASTNYEAALDRVENRMGALASQLATTDDEAFKQFIRQIHRIQRMEILLEPNLLWPFQGHSVFASLFIEEQNPEILQWTRQTIESWKGRLAGVNLFRINLSGARLSRANLSEAGLPGANLSGAELLAVNLSGTNFHGANLSGANLYKADLSGTYLWISKPFWGKS